MILFKSQIAADEVDAVRKTFNVLVMHMKHGRQCSNNSADLYKLYEIEKYIYMYTCIRYTVYDVHYYYYC